MSKVPPPARHGQARAQVLRVESRQAALALALRHRDAGDHAGAVAICRRLLVQEPRWVPVLQLLGVELTALGELDEALEALSEAVALAPGEAGPLLARGRLHLKAGKFQEARADLQAAVERDPASLEAHILCSELLYRLKDLKAAERHARRALELDPASTAALRAYGRALASGKRARDGVAVLQQIVAQDPGSLASWNELGQALLKTRQLEAAGRAFLKAVALDPSAPEPHVGIARCLMRAGHPDQALKRLRGALERTNRSPEVLKEIGRLLRETGDLDGAKAFYEEALRLRPGWYVPMHALAWVEFRRLDFVAGWHCLTVRRTTPKFAAVAPRTSRPLWQGAPDGGPLLLWGEQGLGDEVLFASMLPDLLALPREKIVAVDARLIPLLERAMSSPRMRFVDRRGPETPEADYTEHLPMGDLGGFFRTSLEDFRRARNPYLSADPARVEDYARQLRRTPARLVCGLAWRSRNADLAIEKSLGGQELFELVAGLPCRFVNLQYGDVPREIESMRAAGVDLAVLEDLDLMNDIDGLAAAIMACDVVLTTSNSTAHIAGALGKRTLLVLPSGPGELWYWQSLGERSLWYPSVRILRQERAGDWSAPIAAARRFLEAPDD